MAKARFAYLNRCLEASFTASSEVVNRPVTFLASWARWKKWRSDMSTGDQYVIADFGTARTIKAIALVDWLAHAGGSIRADYWDGAAWVAFGTFAQPAFNPTRVVALWDAVGVSTSKIRIFWTNTGAVSAYVEVGAVVAGDYYQPTYNLIDGFQVRPVDPSLIVRALDGQEEFQERTLYHVVDGTFETEPQTDHDAFRAMIATVGYRMPLLFAIDPGNASETFYARLEDVGLEHAFGTNWTIPVRLVEVR